MGRRNGIDDFFPFLPPTSTAGNMSQQALNKIAPNSPSRAKPNEVETNVATALYELETNVPDMRGALRPLQFMSAREIEVGHGKKAIAISVPVPLLGGWHRSQQRITRELEKKFSDRHVLIIASRRILPRPKRSNRSHTTLKQKRPRSSTPSRLSASASAPGRTAARSSRSCSTRRSVAVSTTGSTLTPGLQASDRQGCQLRVPPA